MWLGPEPQNHKESLELARDMNMLPATRIGFEQRLAYQNWLAELASNGYLTTEEYEARSKWLDGAQTQAEMEAAFADLPRMQMAHILSPGYTGTRPKTEPKPYKPFGKSRTQAGMWAAYGLGWMIFNLVLWNPVGAGLFTAWFVVWGIVFIRRCMNG